MRNICRTDKSVAAALVKRPAFADGRWHRLDELLNFENQLLAVRQSNKAFSDAVRVDRSPEEKLRRDELIPFLDLAHHEHFAPETRFRKPSVDRGIDLEIELDGRIVRLQITTAYPALHDQRGKLLNGGHQYRLHMEKLTAEGMIFGSGPFERRGNDIEHDEGCTTREQIEASCQTGLVKAFDLKAMRGDTDVTLLVKAKGYYQSILDARRFCAIVDAAAKMALPANFSAVVVVDYGPSFLWSSALTQRQ